MDVPWSFGFEGMLSGKTVIGSPLPREIGLDFCHVRIRKRFGINEQFGQVPFPVSADDVPVIGEVACGYGTF